MNKHEIELIQECHRNIEIELDGLVSEVDDRTFDSSEKVAALSRIRSRIIKTKSVIACYVIPTEIADPQGLLKRSESSPSGPDAA